MAREAVRVRRQIRRRKVAPNGVSMRLPPAKGLRDRRGMATRAIGRFCQALRARYGLAEGSACASPRGECACTKTTARTATMPRCPSVAPSIALAHDSAKTISAQERPRRFSAQAPAGDTKRNKAGALSRMKLRFANGGAPMPQICSAAREKPKDWIGPSA